MHESTTSDRFAPPAQFAERSRVRTQDYLRLYEGSVRDPDAFWAGVAQRLDWYRAPTKIKDVSYALEDFHIRWYEDGELNVGVRRMPAG